jgi:hypothetical protein
LEQGRQVPLEQQGQLGLELQPAGLAWQPVRQELLVRQVPQRLEQP